MRRSIILAVSVLLVILSIMASCGRDKQVAIIPGSRIGDVHLGETIDSVMESLGKPQRGDAAMGHAWASWLDTVRITRRDTVIHRQDVYFVTAGVNLDGIRTVQQIRTTIPDDYTPDGLHVGSTFKEISQSYPHLRQVAWRRNGAGPDSVITYDNVAHGIAFEIAHGKSPQGSYICRAIIIHAPNKLAYPTYLPLFPGLRTMGFPADTSK